MKGVLIMVALLALTGTANANNILENFNPDLGYEASARADSYQRERQDQIDENERREREINAEQALRLDMANDADRASRDHDDDK